ncbi:hypothetical protein ACROYT_G026753 [Oculina patagonica]
MVEVEERKMKKREERRERKQQEGERGRRNEQGLHHSDTSEYWERQAQHLGAPWAKDGRRSVTAQRDNVETPEGGVTGEKRTPEDTGEREMDS